MTIPHPLVIIPSRLKAQRLPNKPLLDIGGKPMIVHVWEKACHANIGPVIVATGDPEIQEAVANAGGTAILTDPDLKSGSDRVWAAARLYDPKGIFQHILNVQGDLPLLDSTLLSKAQNLLDRYDIGTLASPLQEGEKEKTSIVKIALTRKEPSGTGQALYFSRAPIPFGTDDGWHHIGIYAYRRNVLETFVSLPPSPLEKAEKLEQLRALEAGFPIGVHCITPSPPLGVDTPEDLEIIRKRFLQKEGL